MRKDIFILFPDENFAVGNDNLSYYSDQPHKVKNGVPMFCRKGEADLTIDLTRYHICPNTSIVLIPNSILHVENATDDLDIHYFYCNQEMFQNASFRLPPALLHFLKENSCHTHTDLKTYSSIAGLTTASLAIYHDKENCFRNTIAQNLLQIFFFDTYDKVQRLFTPSR